jgi:hypothetical protein
MVCHIQSISPPRSHGAVIHPSPLWQHCHCLVSASSSSPCPLSSSHLPPALAVISSKTLTTLLSSSQPPSCQQKRCPCFPRCHGICCGWGTSAGTRALFGLPPMMVQPSNRRPFPATSAQPANGGEPCNGSGGGGQGCHHCNGNQSSPCGIQLPPRRQRVLCHCFCPLVPQPPALSHPWRQRQDHGPTNQVPQEGGPPTDNKTIKLVGQQHTPPSSPPQFSQLANPPILL